MSHYDYYQLNLKLKNPMLGTSTQGSIHYEHVIQKAQKEIAKANKLKGKVTKVAEKYVGREIPENKEVAELQGVVRAYCQLMGKSLEVPSQVDELLALTTSLETEFEDQIKENEQVKATVFARNAEGWPIISTHMILGNLKENLRIMVNNGDKSILKSKVSVGETLALDIKFVDEFMVPSSDILRASNQAEVEKLPATAKGKNTLDPKGRVLLERPIRFERMGKVETAISMSEQLPAGTEFSTTIRVRKDSPVTQDALETLLNFGKSNGLGAWRGSGNMGAYYYQLKPLPDFKEETPSGWN